MIFKVIDFSRLCYGFFLPFFFFLALMVRGRICKVLLAMHKCKWQWGFCTCVWNSKSIPSLLTIKKEEKRNYSVGVHSSQNKRTAIAQNQFACNQVGKWWVCSWIIWVRVGAWAVTGWGSCLVNREVRIKGEGPFLWYAEAWSFIKSRFLLPLSLLSK